MSSRAVKARALWWLFHYERWIGLEAARSAWRGFSRLKAHGGDWWLCSVQCRRLVRMSA